MIKILKYLFLIRFRKLLTKDDFFGIFLILLAYCSIAVIFYKNFETLYYYNYLIFLDIAVNQINRKDIELLKLKANYKLILFTEYLMYLIPF
jgi:hypothetical protein